MPPNRNAPLRPPEGPPDAWRALSLDGRRGWIDAALAPAAEANGWLSPASRLLDEGVVRRLKTGRNRLAVVDLPGAEPPRTAVLKEFGTPGAARSPRDWLRRGRSIRGWDRAFALLARGLATPRPLWILVPERGRGPEYLAVETAPPHTRLREILKPLRKGAARVRFGAETLEAPEALEALGAFTRRMHEAGVWHRDFSGGNLLIPEDWRLRRDAGGAIDTSAFVLVDVNRARLFAPGTLPLSARLQDLERISLAPAQRDLFYGAYAAGDDALASAREAYLKAARRYRRLRETRNPFARFLRKCFTYWIRW